MKNQSNRPRNQIGKNTNIEAFLKAVPHLNSLNYSTVGLLAQRFAVSPEMLALLLNIAAKGGVYYDN